MSSGGGETVTNTDPWAGQQPFLTDIFQNAQGLYDLGPQQYTPFSQVADVNPLQQLGRTNALGYAEGAGQDIIGNTQNAWMQQLNPGLNPMLGGMIDMGTRKIGENLQQNILPGIGSNAIAAGAFGGSRQGVAEGLASKAALQQGSDLTTNMLNNAYNQGIGQQQFALQNAGNMFNLGMMPSGIQQQVGQQYNQDQQAQLTDLVNRWNFEQQSPWNSLQNYSNIVQGNNWGGESTSEQDTGTDFGQIAGLGLMGASLLGFSDIRLKRNVKPVTGALDKIAALRGVQWDWRNDGTQGMGVIADEVESILENAVSMHEKGYKLVNYGELVAYAIEAIKELKALMEAKHVQPS